MGVTEAGGGSTFHPGKGRDLRRSILRDGESRPAEIPLVQHLPGLASVGTGFGENVLSLRSIWNGGSAMLHPTASVVVRGNPVRGGDDQPHQAAWQATLCHEG